MKNFKAPIPGESLTTTPKGNPYERPPEFVEPEKASMFYLDKLNDPEVMGDILDALELGVDLKTLTSGILRSGAAKGIQSVDVSLIIAPIIHEFIKSFADELGIEYDEGFEDKDKEKRDRIVAYAKAEKMLEKQGYTSKMEDTVSQMDEEESETQEFEDSETETYEVAEGTIKAEAPKGLMARR